MKTIVGSLVALVALFGFSFGAVNVADTRYAPMSEFQDLHWSTLRQQIQELRQRISRATGQERTDLERDLEDLLALFCRRYPGDRYCK